VIGFVVIGYFAVNKAKQVAGELEKNPEFTVAKWMVQTNDDVELVSSDETKGTLTVKDKKTGKVITINFRQVKDDGSISFSSDEGEATIEARGDGSSGSVSIKSDKGSVVMGGGASVDLPDWMPQYPGSSPQGVFSARSDEGRSQSFHFITSDSSSDVIDFYEEELKGAGLRVTTTNTTSGGSVTGASSDRNRTVFVAVTSSQSGTQVNVTLNSKN
jgi:hypothetical protein